MRFGSSGPDRGNVLDFVSVMENCSIRDAALKIQRWFGRLVTSETPVVSGSSSLRSPLGRGISLVEESGNPHPLGFQLQPVDTAHDYLRRRGVDHGTAEFFGVGFFGGSGVMSGRVVFPIHNESGELIAYGGRALGTVEARYRFPAGFRKSLILFNLHRALDSENGGTVVVVEGFFDCLKVHQAGVGSVVALMGCTMSGAQERLLKANFRHVILFLDGDDAGRSATSEIAARLVRHVFVRVVDTPSGAQPDEMFPEQVRALLKPAIDCASRFDIHEPFSEGEGSGSRLG